MLSPLAIFIWWAPPTLHISGAPVTGEQYAVVTLKESGDLLRAFNTVLAELRRDGTLAELEKRWLGP